MADCAKSCRKLTWKFFSDQPFFANARMSTSESTSLAIPSTHPVISSSAARRVFQLASAKSVARFDGISSAARASASSGVCLYLNVSRPPGGGAAPPLDGLEGAAAGGSFLTAGAADCVLEPEAAPAAAGFLA